MLSNTSLKVMSRKVPLPERAAARSCFVSGRSSRISMLSTTSSCSTRFSCRHSGLERRWAMRAAGHQQQGEEPYGRRLGTPLGSSITQAA
jgi:hypothetical protein